MDQLACIHAFVATVEEGSVHAAAVKLQQTDAAISKKVSRLEASLGISLMERGYGKITLTDIGQQYYYHCKAISDRIIDAQQLIEQATMVPHGELNVSCVRHNAYRYLMPKLKGFMRQYPKIQLNMTMAERVPDFAHDAVDILFGIAMSIPEQDIRLVRKQIGLTRDIFCATPSFLRTVKLPQKPKDLLALPYICHTARKPMNILDFDHGLELQVHPILKCDDHESVVHAASQGLGFIYVKEYMVEEYLKSGQLTELLPTYKKTEYPVFVYYRYATYPDPKIQAFMDYFTHVPSK
jgi:DNA-binding transcriptional LysR family regulator